MKYRKCCYQPTFQRAPENTFKSVPIQIILQNLISPIMQLPYIVIHFPLKVPYIHTFHIQIILHSNSPIMQLPYCMAHTLPIESAIHSYISHSIYFALKFSDNAIAILYGPYIGVLWNWNSPRFCSLPLSNSLSL